MYPAKLPCLGRGRPYTDAAKPAEDWAKNRFEAQNPPRIASKTDLEPETRRGLGQKQVFGARRPLISHPQQLTRNNEQLTRNNEQLTSQQLNT